MSVSVIHKIQIFKFHQCQYLYLISDSEIYLTIHSAALFSPKSIGISPVFDDFMIQGETKTHLHNVLPTYGNSTSKLSKYWYSTYIFVVKSHLVHTF